MADSPYITVYKRRWRMELLVHAARWHQKAIPQKVQINDLINLYWNVQWTMFVIKGGGMRRHHMGPIRKHPDRRSCLIVTAANTSVGWQTECFSWWVSLKSSPQNFLHSTSFHNTWQMAQILCHILLVLVLKKFRARGLISASYGEFLKLP